MTAKVQPIEALAVIDYGVSEIELASARKKYASLTCDTSEGYEEVRLAIADLRGTRTKIEKRRVELKADALSWGRKVDAAAKDLTAIIETIEGPLRAKKQAVDEAEAQAKRDAERADLIALEAKIKADREAEEARLAGERATFAAAQAKAEEDRRASEAILRAERERLDAERAAVEEQKRVLHDREVAAARAEAERQAKAKAERDAAEAAERARVAAEEQEAARAAEAARLEALRPDVERVQGWAGILRTIVEESAPLVDSEEAKGAVAWALGRVSKIADALADFTGAA